MATHLTYLSQRYMMSDRFNDQPAAADTASAGQESSIYLDNQIYESDEQIMALVVTGETAALEILYDRYASTVMGIAVKMLSDRTLAEEIVQETFWRVWQKSASFQSHQGKFAGWLFGIARNLCVDVWRRNESRPQLVSPQTDTFEIEQEPAEVAAGGDPQLEKAVEVALELLIEESVSA